MAAGSFDGRVETWLDRLHPEDRVRLQAEIEQTLTGRTDYGAEFRVIWADGRTRWLAAQGQAFYNPAGQPVRMLGVAFDITERREAEAERARLLAAEREARASAETALQLRNALLSSITHDLRTPLTTVMGLAQLLRRQTASMEPPVGPRLQKGLGSIESAATQMTRMTTDLLDGARLASGHGLELQRAPVDLVALVSRQMQDYQPRATAGHELRFESTSPALVGQWDAARLERVLANLLDNALKYSPAGGAITVRVSSDSTPEDGSAWAELAVQDEGLGIPAADLPRVFDQFHRGENVSARIAGSGIGLFGARHIVEQHGGTIGVVSVEGAGSIFTVRLPLDERPARS
jgi:signal transduction histidine kinase